MYSKRGEYKRKLLLGVAILLASLWLVSALNQSSENSDGLGILPVEETQQTESSPTGAPISILPVEPPTTPTGEAPPLEPPSESPTGAPISILPIPSDENQNIPAEEPTPPVSEDVIPTPSLFSTLLNLVIDKITAFVGEVINIRATLTDENLTPLPDKKIDFYAENYIGSDITNKEGIAEIFWNTSLVFPNPQVIVAEYKGDNNYASSSMRATVTINENQNNKAIPTKKKFKIKDEEGNIVNSRLKVADNFVEELDEGTYNLTVLPKDYPVSKIEFKNVQISDEVNFGLSAPNNITTAGNLEFTKTYALNPEGMVFENAVVTSIAQGETLYKCKEWDFINSLCLGTWKEMMNLTIGEEYSFILTADDPGFAEGHLRNIPPLSVVAHVLAKVFNQDNLDYDREYARQYLSLRHNFSDLPYREVNNREDFSLTMGNKPNDVGGFRINNSRFAVHVVYCDGFAGFCKFRINGVLTPRLYFPEKLDSGKTDAFDLDGNYVLKIKSAQFELCDNQRFCHFGYEGYDQIEATIERKQR